MKIRKGFVSNSSSSSFLIMLDKKPKSIEETKKLFFGDKEFYEDPYYDCNSSYFNKRSEKYKADMVAEIVFNDLKNQKPMNKKQISEELDYGWIDGGPEYDSYFPVGEKHEKETWERYHKDMAAYLDKIAEEMLLEAGDKEIFCLGYSDDTELGCAMEHGTLFDNIPTYRISKH